MPSKKYLLIQGMYDEYETRCIPLDSKTTKKEIQKLIEGYVEDHDIYASNCEQDDRWPEAKVITVSDEKQIDVQSILVALEKKQRELSKAWREQSERNQYEALKKKFEGQ